LPEKGPKRAPDKAKRKEAKEGTARAKETAAKAKGTAAAKAKAAAAAAAPRSKETARRGRAKALETGFATRARTETLPDEKRATGAAHASLLKDPLLLLRRLFPTPLLLLL
jgi:hypothetical protein